MGAYAAVTSRLVLPEPAQDISSNSKYERTMKGAAAMATIKVPSMLEYVLFPAERRSRRLREDGGRRDVQRLKRNYRDNETKGEGRGKRGGEGRKDRGIRGTKR